MDSSSKKQRQSLDIKVLHYNRTDWIPSYPFTPIHSMLIICLQLLRIAFIKLDKRIPVSFGFFSQDMCLSTSLHEEIKMDQTNISSLVYNNFNYKEGTLTPIQVSSWLQSPQTREVAVLLYEYIVHHRYMNCSCRIW
jgi:hypothetical protein